MTAPGTPPRADATEWAGRALVAMQFGLLAALGWGAALPALAQPNLSVRGFYRVAGLVAGDTLNVNDQGDASVVEQRLIAGFQVDDRQSAHGQTHPRVIVLAAVIQAPMDELATHA